MIIAAIAAPVAGPVVKPMCWLPKASQRPAMPRRGPDHRQAVGQRRPRAAPGVADLLAEFDDAARQRLHRVDLGEGFDGASRSVSSTPEVTRMPFSIGVIRKAPSASWIGRSNLRAGFGLNSR